MKDAAIDALVAGFYAVFDNRGGRRASIEEMTALFIEGAIISKSTHESLQVASPREFAAPRVALLHGPDLVDFHEWETSSQTHVAGDLASRISRYRKSGTFHGEPYGGEGTKLFQFARQGGEWRILALAWIDD